MSKSTHAAVVIKLNLRPHPNADALSICELKDGRTVVLRTEDWDGHSKAVYIPPQNLVDTNLEEFAWLKSGDERWALVKPCKLRGIHSYGLCVKCPEDANIGDDLTEYLQIKHYEPELTEYDKQTFTNGGKLGHAPKYDIDSVYKKVDVWTPGEEVVVTEKIHGQNMRVYWDGETLHVGGRNKWFTRDNNSLYWRAVNLYPQIEVLCRSFRNYILYGEQYGHTNLKYGKDKVDVGFAAFDLRRPDMRYVSYSTLEQICKEFEVPMVPLICKTTYNLAELNKLSEGMTTLPDRHVREGVVVRPKLETLDESGDRKIFKIINPEYQG